MHRETNATVRRMTNTIYTAPTLHLDNVSATEWIQTAGWQYRPPPVPSNRCWWSIASGACGQNIFCDDCSVRSVACQLKGPGTFLISQHICALFDRYHVIVLWSRQSHDDEKSREREDETNNLFQVVQKSQLLSRTKWTNWTFWSFIRKYL